MNSSLVKVLWLVMEGLRELVSGDSVAAAIVIVGLVAASGIALGSLKVRGVGLGVAGVLFTGLAFGHFGVAVNPAVADFIREFGLILFVYTIGLQVGPGFFASLRRQGAPLNSLAAGVVGLGAALAWAAHRFLGVDLAAAAGLFSGATTNTPSLGAAREALTRLPEAVTGPLGASTLAYAISYPFGVAGIILTMLILRGALRVNVRHQEEIFQSDRARQHPRLRTLNVRVTNPNLEGMELEDVPGLRGSGVVVSRIQRAGEVSVARGDTRLASGDILLAVGPPGAVENFRVVVGEASEVDLRATPGELEVRRIVVTRKAVIGRTLGDLGLETAQAVRFTRMIRAEIDLPDPLNRRLQAGDVLTVVGDEASLEQAARALGNSMRDLNAPQMIPLFAGIILGVLLGSIPISIPYMPAPVKLGLAGGPLIVAIVLSHIGRIGPLVWYMPSNANAMLRELGIVLFLSVVGLKAGDRFVETLLMGDGLLWLGCGAVVTLLPLLVAGLVGLVILRLNYLTLIGVLAGSMTDPPALAFANSVTSTPAPALSYAAVYPLTMLLRVVAIQVLILVSGG